MISRWSAPRLLRGAALASALAALGACTSPFGAGTMHLQTQGIFWAGGEVVQRTQPGATDNRILRNPVYVEYFIPKNLDASAAPIVLTHSSLSGVVWRTTPDGREGWAEYFIRRGFPVFVIDPPGTGRAGFDVDDINLAARGQSQAATSDPLIRTDSASWARWSIGPRLGEASKGGQMSTDDASVRHFLGSMIPSRAVPNAAVDTAFIAALEKIHKMFGRAIFVGWSTAGGLGQRLVIARPDLIRALVILEGYNGQLPLPTASNWFDYCPLNPPNAVVSALVKHRLPLLSVNGQAGHSINAGRAKDVCQTLVDRVKADGGDATNIWLPDVGVSGNSHMLFWDRNGDEAANVVLGWLNTALRKQ